MKCAIAGALGMGLALGLRRAARSRRLRGRIGDRIINVGVWLLPPPTAEEQWMAHAAAQRLKAMCAPANGYKGP